MIYLDPTNDVAFKKLFGDMAHKDIIISFLNSILERKDGEEIVDATMNDTSNVPESENQKPNVIDIKCTTQSGNQYIVLLQVIKEKKDIDKMFVYSSLALVNQYNPRKYVQSFIPVIVVGVLDFISFKNPNYLSHHCFLDQETKEQKIKDFEYYFIELPKFKKKLEELTTLAEKWIYFLSNAHEQNKMPDNLSELEEAFLVLNKNSWKTKELEEYERHLNSIRIKNDEIDTARYEAEEKGREKGKLEEKINLAKQFLDILDVETVAKKTGLDIEIVKKLKPKQ